MGKLLERMLLHRLEVCVETAGGLSPNQFGFRRGKSTVDAIAKVVNAARTATTGTRNKKGYCAMATLDVRNAFNTAKWWKIMEALAERQTPEYLLRVIDSYLDERILIYGTDAGEEEHQITAGVPQGSVLGPFLWNVMYNGLLNLELPERSEIVGFADDVAVVMTAQTTRMLAVLTNETIRRISNWLRENGLTLAAHKTEAVLITKRRAFKPPMLTLENESVQWKKSVRYLGVQIDGGLRYTEHVLKTTEKAASTAAALARLMPNIGGPKECKRRLLNSVIHSKILYGAEVWVEAIEKETTRRNLAAVQRRSALRITSAFRTVSEGAALVLANVPPIDLLIREKQERYVATGTDNEEKTKCRALARQRLMERWQERWDAGTTGRWTHRLIPNLKKWCERTHGQVNYHLTQALTGHGCFNGYLFRFKRAESAKCLLCGHESDDAEHAIFEYPRTERERLQLWRALGGQMSAENLVQEMLREERNWVEVSKYIRKIIDDKRKAEQNSQLPNP